MKQREIALRIHELPDSAAKRGRGLLAVKGVLALSGLAVASVMFAAPANAGCADPRGGGASIIHQLPALPGLFGERSEHHSIVGTWKVSYTGGPPDAQAFIQWHSDGTEWENIDYPVLGGNICMGSWKQLNRNTYARNHYGWLFDGGYLSGYFNETETDVLSKDGNSYTGTNETKMYDKDGTLTMDFTGTASAQRIEP